MIIDITENEYEIIKNIASNYCTHGYNLCNDWNKNHIQDAELIGVMAEYALGKYIGLKINDSTTTPDDGYDFLYLNNKIGCKGSKGIYDGGLYLNINKLNDCKYFVFNYVDLENKTVEILGYMSVYKIKQCRIEQKSKNGRLIDVLNYRIPYDELTDIMYLEFEAELN